MTTADTQQRCQTSDTMMKYGMWACCAIMLVPAVLYFAADGLSGGLLNNAIMFAPLLVCLGAHFIMHRLMGESCHGEEKGEKAVTAKTQVQIGQIIAPE